MRAARATGDAPAAPAAPAAPGAPATAPRAAWKGAGLLDAVLGVLLVLLLVVGLAVVPSLGVPWLVVYLPLGLFGLVRWLVWLARRLPAVAYRPYPVLQPAARREAARGTVSIITPVYREDPGLFERAIRSWLAERPREIIAVIDASDEWSIAIARSYPVKVVVTDVPGKRPALALGIQQAQGSIVALVDSDTVWTPGALDEILGPFEDPKIGGVGTRQAVEDRSTIWQRLADVYLSMRYDEEVPAQTVMGRAVSCLSGRTAAYRTDLIRALLPEFLDERFLGQLCMSGEDKRFTSLILREGYDTYYQGTALVYSAFPPDLRTAMNQRIRWARNSFRSDLRGLWEGWLWRRPYLSVMLIDRMLSPYALLVSLGFFVASIVTAQWIATLALAGWWLLSRAVRILPHLRRHPADVLILPAFVAFTFLMAGIKVYALLTVHQHKWLTRPVEVVDGEVVRSGTKAARTRAPVRSRVLGASLVAGLAILTQASLLALGGAGYLPRTDTAPPRVEVAAPPVGVPGQTVLRASAEDTFQEGGLTYRWLIDGLAEGTAPELVLPPDQPPGPARWSVYVRDAAGNTGTASGTIEVQAP